MAIDGEHWRVRALCLLGFLAPFNVSVRRDGDVLRQPLVTVALIIGVLTLLSAWWANRRLPHNKRIFLTLWLAWVGLLWLVTLLSPEPLLSSGVAARISVGAVAMAAAVFVVNEPTQMARVLRSLVAGAVLATAIGATVQLLGRDFSESDRFFGEVTRLGPYDRLTRPWSHANVAAMAIGATIAGAAAIRTTSLRFLAAATLVLGVVLTYSRGGFISVVLGAAVWIVLRWRTGQCTRAEQASVAALVVLGLVAALVLPGWTGRVSGQDRLDWWQVELDVPDSILLGSEAITTTIGVTNTSSAVWGPSGDEPVLVTARWVLPNTDIVRAEQRWPLPTDIEPGDQVDVEVFVDTTVPNGTYEVHWDLFIEARAYFQQFAGLPPSISQGRVVDARINDSFPPVANLVPPREFPGRTEIWSASVDAFLDSPLVGIGPGRLSATMPPNAQAGHSHNLVLEPLATWGLLATAPFLALMIGALVRSLAIARRNGDVLSTAVACGVVMIAIHGAVDWSLIHVSAAIPTGFICGLAWATPGGRARTPA